MVAPENYIRSSSKLLDPFSLLHRSAEIVHIFNNSDSSGLWGKESQRTSQPLTNLSTLSENSTSEMDKVILKLYCLVLDILTWRNILYLVSTLPYLAYKFCMFHCLLIYFKTSMTLGPYIDLDPRNQPGVPSLHSYRASIYFLEQGPKLFSFPGAVLPMPCKVALKLPYLYALHSL